MTLGFHLGPTGNAAGIGEYMRRLDEAGIPFFIKSTDSYGICLEATQYTNANHVIIYRMSTAGQNDGFDYDVPAYALSPYNAASLHWRATRDNLPPEFDKSRVWIEPINEVDKNKSGWLADFAYSLAYQSRIEGYRVTMPAYASGEPEVIDNRPWVEWTAYLKLCADNPGRCAISLHEYNLYHESWEAVYPWSIGRFQWLFDECDRQGINRPVVHITEYGWSLDHVPTWDDAKPQITQTSALYARYGVAGGAIWNLGQYGSNDVHNQTQRLIAPLTDWIIANPQPAGNPNEPLDPNYFESEPPPTEDWKETLWRQSIDEQLIRLNPEAAIQKAIFDRDFVPVSNEFSADIDGVAGVGQAAEDLHTGERLVFYAVPPTWNVEELQDPALPSFAWEVWPTEYKKINQLFGARPDHYGQWGLPGHEGLDIKAPSGSLIYAVADGVVVLVGDDTLPLAQGGHNYGRRVYVRSGEYVVKYAHLATRRVNLGDVIRAGQTIGQANSTGNSDGSHLHLTMTLDGATAAGLTDYPGDIIDPTPYAMAIAPEAFGPPPPAGTPFDMLQYMRGDKRRYEVQTSWGPQESMQTQPGRPDEFFHVKNSIWEQLFFDDFYIMRGVDTSPGGDRYYRLSDDGNSDRSRWIPRRMAIGQSYERSPIVRLYRKSDCVLLASDLAVTWIRLEAVHDFYTFDLTGLTVENVAELVWSFQENGPALETYFYAQGFGLVGWRSEDGRQSAISEIHEPGTRPDLVREMISCLE